MKTIHQLICSAAVAAVLLFAPVSNADTLVLSFETRLTSSEIEIPEQYADLNAIFDSFPENGDTSAQIVVPNFENYATGTHVVPMNVGNGLNFGPDASLPPQIVTPGLTMILESGLLGALEGVRTFSYDESEYDDNLNDGRACNDAAGCDLLDADGNTYPRRFPADQKDGVVDSVYNPRTFLGVTIEQDETQLADYGAITIADGVVESFTYGWVAPGNAGTVSVNDFLVDRRGFPVVMESLTIDVDSFSTPNVLGGVAFVQGFNADIQVVMADAVPEPGTLALGGLVAAFGFGFTRRR